MIPSLTITSVLVNHNATMTVAGLAPSSENFISIEQVLNAVEGLGMIQGDHGVIEVADVIAAMTGLEMTRYNTVLDRDALGWRIVRRETEADG